MGEKQNKVVHEVIQNNAYWAHPENLLLSMVVDERREVRDMAVARILTARQRPSEHPWTRDFLKPVLNFDARVYIEMIDWDRTMIFEPPITKQLTENEPVALSGGNQEILARVADDLRFPCHTQAVER